MDYLYGVIGFLGFEGLRIYKVLWADIPIAPHNKKYLYGITIICLSVFSSIVAHAFSNGNIVEALYIGFSVPTGLKALSDKPHRKDKPITDNVDGIDDIEIRKSNTVSHTLHWLNSYFRFG